MLATRLSIYFRMLRDRQQTACCANPCGILRSYRRLQETGSGVPKSCLPLNVINLSVVHNCAHGTEVLAENIAPFMSFLMYSCNEQRWTAAASVELSHNVIDNLYDSGAVPVVPIAIFSQKCDREIHDITNEHVHVLLICHVCFICCHKNLHLSVQQIDSKAFPHSFK